MPMSRWGAAPSFTCAPYLLEDRPVAGEDIAWAESNAVIYANSVLGARTVKHADFMDLCIALTGRAPQAGVYLEVNRAPRRVVHIRKPEARMMRSGRCSAGWWARSPPTGSR